MGKSVQKGDYHPSLPEEEKLLQIYATMLKIRYFENKVQELFEAKAIPGAVHLCTGQEAIYAGASAALNDGDYVTCTYRGHGVFISRGSDINRLMAEILGKATGICKGKGGSMHFTDLGRGLLGSFAIVGEGIPVAVGAGLTSKLRKEDRIAASFFGDGASNIGMFHESLNMASVWKLPVIFICENNMYGEYSPLSATTAVENIADRASAYNMPGEQANGNDVLDVYEKVKRAATRARTLQGPTLLECKTYRHRGHSEIDSGEKYRSIEEVRKWQLRDPIESFRKTLIKEKHLTEAKDNAMQEEIHALIERAVRFAIDSPVPATDEIVTDVYALE
ncbi:MAG TPA: thiamine pyrophosphate-dependent dehydrogenase E1 component subunit alpha [Nitrososphaerales archaeon]|nr:thiamine pyrophosphate-dependent dehydrogenase E1 component subunit alpha [Nitrososphaerales archaeon]